MLQAIIGQGKGTDTLNKNFIKIDVCKRKANVMEAHNTNSSSLKYIEEKVNGKNVYIRVSNLTDPQEFYFYLSREGYTLLDSRIIQDYTISQDAKRLNENYAQIEAKLKNKPMPQQAVVLQK